MEDCWVLGFRFLEFLKVQVYIQSAAIPSKSASKISIKAPKGRKSTKLRTRLPSALVQLAKITLKINTKSTATKSTEPTIDSVVAIVLATVLAIVPVLVLVPAIVLALAIAS
ncbi:uncharacterized protein RCO7_03460 [Rhynchosporium graminicola]|uniref:Uncharacterized protein n=1 Tax=Rhynchosporium graminicola TaxID=2792576 RepID=A0A1E1LED6_9HELO|nr:uncharacterized protein RCO7_03460 [Rhynchosporium commune]